MKGIKQPVIKRDISRREFAGKSIIAAIALGTAGIASYAVLHEKRGRITWNYYRMGHCAPAVMQTLLDINDIDDIEPVRISGAMAGGTGGPEMECGALTAPLMFLGYQKGIPEGTSEKLMIIRQAQAYFRNFNLRNGSTICNHIRNRSENGCRRAVSGFYGELKDGMQYPVMPGEKTGESYSLLLDAFGGKGFHCSHNVLEKLNEHLCFNRMLYRMSWPFLGGIALMNRTCGALAAGVMALSSKKASVELRFRKVEVMNKMMKEDDPRAMNNEINAFNMAINSGTELGTWFRKEFGSTTCRDIWGYDFSQRKDADKFLAGNCLIICSTIADKVAEKVASMI